ncbi:MAG: hypothetical protein JW955_17410 [Sedimentisphaerales bacterium]|nr:hypothetical protein [Sedimentisphaerales bacterium]
MEQAIRDLLRAVPETWGEYDPDGLTELQSRALFLLVAAGMVERRTTFRLRLFGHPVAAEATITVTGEYGAVEALERLAAGVWEEWRDAYEKRCAGELKKAPAFHCERIGREQWRLTAEGIQGRQDVDAGELKMVLDFVLRHGFFDGAPRLMPDGRITRREPVRGRGALERVELVKTPAGPAGVNITNWEAGGQAFADAFAAAFVMLQQKASSATPKAAPAYTVAAVLEMAGLSSTTLNRYAKLAGIKTPQRGKRNHRYDADEVRATLKAIIENTSDRAMKERRRAALANL